MLILEKPFCDEEFFEASTLEDIKKSPSNSVLVFKYCDSSLEVYNFCKKNSISYGVEISSLKELLFCANLGAKYVFCDKIEKAKLFQKTAENYLLDTKIVLYVENLDEIEQVAHFGIDAIKLKGRK